MSATKRILDVLGNPVRARDKVIVIDQTHDKFQWDDLKKAKVTKVNKRSVTAIVDGKEEAIVYRVGRFVRLYQGKVRSSDHDCC